MHTFTGENRDCLWAKAVEQGCGTYLAQAINLSQTPLGGPVLKAGQDQLPDNHLVHSDVRLSKLVCKGERRFCRKEGWAPHLSTDVQEVWSCLCVCCRVWAHHPVPSRELAGMPTISRAELPVQHLACASSVLLSAATSLIPSNISQMKIWTSNAIFPEKVVLELTMNTPLLLL